MTVKSEDEAILMCVPIIDGGRRVHEQEGIKRQEAVKVLGNLKNGKAAGLDGIIIFFANRCYSPLDKFTIFIRWDNRKA